MEQIFTNTGLSPIFNSIFMMLDAKSLLQSSHVSKIWRERFNQPFLWLQKCVVEGLPQEFRHMWFQMVQSTIGSELEKNVLVLLQKMVLKRSFNSPLHIAASEDDFELMVFMLENTEQPLFIEQCTDFDGNSPLHKAAENGHVEMVQLLLEYCENPNKPNSKGWSAIHLADLFDRHDVVDVLSPFLSETEPTLRLNWKNFEIDFCEYLIVDFVENEMKNRKTLA